MTLSALGCILVLASVFIDVIFVIVVLNRVLILLFILFILFIFIFIVSFPEIIVVGRRLYALGHFSGALRVQHSTPTSCDGLEGCVCISKHPRQNAIATCGSAT